MLPARRSNWLPSIFNDFFGNEWVERQRQSSPAMNIIETEKEYKVEFAAPGLTSKDFRIDLHDDNRLTVSMDKKTDGGEKDSEGRYLRREFSHTSFRQSMILPDDVNKEAIAARVEDGILTVEIPKMPEEHKTPVSKQIEVK